MPTIIRDARRDELVPDATSDNSYTLDELHNAKWLGSDAVTGAETFQLTDGRLAVLQSIDLDWVAPANDPTLKTKKETKVNTYHYFSGDGNYGSDVPLVVPTTEWTEEDWREIEDCSDGERIFIALEISKKYK